jgi:hypothetical protein
LRHPSRGGDPSQWRGAGLPTRPAQSESARPATATLTAYQLQRHLIRTLAALAAAAASRIGTMSSALARRHDRMFRYTGACGSNEKCRRLGVPAFGRGFCASVVDWAIPVPEDRGLALAARSDSCCRRTLHGIHSVVDRMQRPTCPFDRFRRHRQLHGAARVHATADTARNKQPRKETHPKPQAMKWLC